MTNLKSTSDIFESRTEELLDQFDTIIQSFNPPEPLHVKKLELAEASEHLIRPRDLIAVYEDEECIIYMERS